VKYPDRARLRPLLAGAIALVSCYRSTVMVRLIGRQRETGAWHAQRCSRRRRNHERYWSAQTFMQLRQRTEQLQSPLEHKCNKCANKAIANAIYLSCSLAFSNRLTC